MRLIDPSQRINVLWDNDDGTRYAEDMTIRRLLAVMSDDEVETIELVRCGECKYRYVDGDNVRYNVCELLHNKVQSDEWFCADGERREDG